MVYGLIIHSIDSSQKPYFSIFYSKEGNESNKKIRMQMIINRVKEEHLIQIKSHRDFSSDRKIQERGADEDWSFNLRKSAFTGSDYTEGIIRLDQSDLFSSLKLAIWKQVDSIAYTVICDPMENLLLARTFLKSFMNIIYEKLTTMHKKMTFPEKIMNYPDEVLLVLHHLLPGGQLLFMNLSQIRSIQADMKQYS